VKISGLKLTTSEATAVVRSFGLNPADFESVVRMDEARIIVTHRAFGCVMAFAKGDKVAFSAACEVILDFVQNGVAGGFVPTC